MRNPLKRHLSTEPKPSLRERLGAMKAKAAGLGSGADKGRRAMLAGALATTLPLPALAASDQPSEKEVAFLALAPEIPPLLHRLGLASDEATRLYEAGDVAAGKHPGWTRDDTSAAKAWVVMAQATRDANGYSETWSVAQGLNDALSAQVDRFLNDPMRTLPAIALKAALAPLGDWWPERALVDLNRLAAENFGLPFIEPAPFELAISEDDEA